MTSDYFAAPTEYSIAYLIIAGIMGLIGAVIVVMLLWRTLRWIPRHADVFGPTTEARLIGLAVAALFFPNAVYRAVMEPIRLVLGFFWYVPFKLDPYALQDQLYDQVLTELIGGFSERFFAFIDRLPVLEILFALAVWMVVGQLFQLVRTGEQPTQSKLVTIYQSMAMGTRKNILLFAILFLGAYLSIAAIAAIPWFEETEIPQDLQKGALRDRLNAYSISENQFAASFPLNYGADHSPFSAFDEYVAAGFASSNIKTLASNLGSIRQREGQTRLTSKQYEMLQDFLESKLDAWSIESRNALTREADQREALLKRWNQFVAVVKTEQERLLNTAVDQFELTNIGRKGTRERILHFELVGKWYRDRIAELEWSLANSMAYIDRSTADSEEWAQRQRRKLEAAVKNLETYGLQFAADPNLASLLVPDSPLNLENVPEFSVSETSSYLARTPGIAWSAEAGGAAEEQAFLMPQYDERLPEPPEAGLGLGIFGFVMSWLLKTQSTPLALITGMLGFGLLGSTVATFVREQKQLVDRSKPRERAEALVQDLSGVMIQGLSAAVVVFLAVKGGLAVFTTGESDPNPYVLFFTVLVGAAFSGHVWDWARGRLRTTLPTDPAAPQ